jgi:hypothetical protein
MKTERALMDEDGVKLLGTAARKLMVTLFATVVAVSILAAPLAAQAQGPRKIPRIGIVATGSPVVARHQVDAFREGLREFATSIGRTS